MFLTQSGEGSGATAKGPSSGKHTRSYSVSSLEGAFLLPLTTPDSMPKESVKKKKGFFERLSKSVVRHSKSGRSTTHRPFCSPSVVPPPVVPPSPVEAPTEIADMGEEDVTVADLTKHLKQAFEEISLSANYRMPTFYGKKGENPEDHCMKAEDYFKVYKIEKDGDKRKRFTDTLFLTARRWAEQLPDAVVHYDYGDTPASKEISIKYLFLQRFALKGQTMEAMYMAWMQLSFDSSKDNIEEFINEVKNLAKRLGYNEQAQVMAKKNHLPLELYHNCLTIDNLKDLTDFLVKVYNNPKMKEKLGIRDKATSTSGVTTHAFSMGQSLDTHFMDSSAEIGKLKAEIWELKYRVCESTVTLKNNEQKYKPMITPPRRRGGNFCGGGSFGNRSQGTQNVRDNWRNQNNGTFRPRGQNFNNRGNKRYGTNQSQNFRSSGRFGVRGRFDNSPDVRHPRVASKTVDKDKGRCYYCKEIGHFVNKSTKKVEDDRRQARYNSMGQATSQFEDWEIQEWDDDNVGRIEHLNN